MYPPYASKMPLRLSSPSRGFAVRKPRNSRPIIISALTVAIIFLVWFQSDQAILSLHKPTSTSTKLPSPANSTLGFGAIIAVSPPNSKRRHGLLQAANVTELDITIPELPIWTEEDVEQFRSQQAPTEMRFPMIAAWMSHLRVLEWFLSTDLETAMILEDDMDWDMRARSLQVPRAATALRALFHATPEAPHSYYPHPSHWDVLYLGHFDRWAWFGHEAGVGVQLPSDLQGAQAFADDTLPPRYNMLPNVASILTALDVPPFTRVVHPSRQPFGTWAYAVNRRSAAKILSDEVGSPRAPKWVSDSFDNTMVRACENGLLRCWTVFPEIFHHREGLLTSMINLPDEFKPTKLVEELRNRTGETDGIGCGFASGVLNFGDDKEELERLRDGARRGVSLQKKTMAATQTDAQVAELCRQAFEAEHYSRFKEAFDQHGKATIALNKLADDAKFLDRERKQIARKQAKFHSTKRKIL
ncbi:uncharacterized protein BDZ99DRAFT_568376 [Mytilinidion resinicola]|uniref:Glycosyltransferase family 25 protein n=1 Tax=Mytilinidion resinicola TaxID=574789 RepID=A0A6A6YWI7_9PEZI|nr:uncharacterized protein BDZ99DRAFT_568376 [Mytilinidion resinicola]KAF2813130.1 hypothetical protein BDZ99DRAFT_568376 [Mytilinidion resinicola]